MSRKTPMRYAVVLAAGLVVGGCAGHGVKPPTDEISDAATAIQQAQQAGAHNFAAFEITKAQRDLSQAKELANSGKKSDRTASRRLAENAAVEARLAESQARLAQTRKLYQDVTTTLPGGASNQQGSPSSSSEGAP